MLSALEANVVGAPGASGQPAQIDTAASVWVIPNHLGEIPPSLRDRAHRIAAGQRTLIARLEDQQQVTGRHLAAVRAIPPVVLRGTSAYLDVTG